MLINELSNSRVDFVNSWVNESPQRVDPINSFSVLIDNIKSLSEYYDVITINSTLRKIEANDLIVYWIEQNNEIALAIELTKKPHTYEVNLTGKNDKFRNQPPFASDLYIDILKDCGSAIKITSDKTLTDEGAAIWKKLLRSGLKVFVYNMNDLSNLIRLNSIEDIENNLNDSNTRFILSEAKVAVVVESRFRLRKYRETNSII